MSVKKSETKIEKKEVPVSTEGLRTYELMVIIRQMLSEDDRLKAQKKLDSTIRDLGGVTTSTDVWGKKHLAYEIDGQSEGYYIVYKCGFPGESIAKFEKQIKMNKTVLRYLLIKEGNL